MAATFSLRDLLRAPSVLIDVRAPVEFDQGHVPNAVNLPLLTDNERHAIGCTFAAQGQAAAISHGRRLVSGDVRRQRVDAWCDAARGASLTRVCCWRGGLRSQITCEWLNARGVNVQTVPGGYKRLRRDCLRYLESFDDSVVILAGRTGSGKTELLRQLSGSVDLEGLAHHRGSAFGATDRPQPSQASFENALAFALLACPQRPIVLEDESRMIGRLALPERVHQHMQTAPVVLLEVPTDQRIRNIAREYVLQPLEQGTPPAALQARYEAALSKLRRRLGDKDTRELLTELAAGFRTGEHEAWIGGLLRRYYDPMYDYQIERKAQRILCRGSAHAVLDRIRGVTPYAAGISGGDRGPAAGPQVRAPAAQLPRRRARPCDTEP